MFDFDVSGMIWMIVNLLVLFLGMKKFFFKPINNMIDSRQKEIDHNLTAANDQRIKAESMMEEYREKMEVASEEAGNIVAQAKTRGDNEYQHILKSAHLDAEKLTLAAQAQIETERLAMIDTVKNDVASLALLAATKVSSRSMSEEEDGLIIEAFLAEVGEGA